MPLDGIMLHGVIEELKEKLIGGVIDKISQPSRDEIVLTIRISGKNEKLLLSANANYSRVSLTSQNKPNPQSAPLFCMLLRKHLNRGRVIDIEQMRFERIIRIFVETYDEMGDLVKKILNIEIMGKHSNIILINSHTNTIIDCIKHIDFEMSRVREVMPGRFYEFPPSKGTIMITDLNFEEFKSNMNSHAESTITEYILNTVEGMSKVLSKNICIASAIDITLKVNELSASQINDLFNTIENLKTSLKNNMLEGLIISKPNNTYSDFTIKVSDKNLGGITSSKQSLNEIMDTYYIHKDYESALQSKRANGLRTVKEIYNKIYKKFKIHEQTVNSSKDYDIYRIYGDLINSNLYSIAPESSNFTTVNYYDEAMSNIDIPLDKNLTAVENSQKYYRKYNKLKKTYTFSQNMMHELKNELYYIESQLFDIEAASTQEDIEEILEELQAEEYIKKPLGNKKNKKASLPSKPHHFISSSGFNIYVGKNSTQNDYLTIKTASKEDIWLHTKEIPGSHVIIKTDNKQLDDSSLLEAALLAAYFSKSRMSSSVPVDYTERKNVKKPSGSKPGMVIYENYNTAYVTPSEDEVSKIKRIE